MIKLFIKLFFVFSLVFSTISQATLVTTNLSSEDYILFDYNGISYDVAWASKVNSERWYFGSTFNTLYSPTIQTGWEYASLNATNNSLEIFSDLSGVEILALFTDDNNSYIQAFEYWNSEFTSSIETANILSPQIRSEWTITWEQYKTNYKGVDLYSREQDINNMAGAAYDTFYIRPSQIPEPSTLMIFALGLIVLVSTKKLFS